MNMTMQHKIKLDPLEADSLIDREIRRIAQVMSSSMYSLLEEYTNEFMDPLSNYLQLHAVAMLLAENVGISAEAYEKDPREWWNSVKQVGDETFEDYLQRKELVSERKAS